MGVQVGHLFVRSPFKHWCMESRTQVIQVLVVRPTQETEDHEGESMTESRFDPEDEAFNDIERTSKIRQEIIRRQMELPQTRNNIIEEVLQRIKELRPAIKPLDGMGRGKTTDEWFDILVKDIEGMKK